MNLRGVVILNNEVFLDIINALRNGTVPAEGTSYFAVGIDKELEQIEEQLNYIKNEKTAFKFIIGDYGSGKTFFSTCVREKSFRKNFVVSSVTISQEAPLHKFEELYRKIMDGMRIEESKGIPAFSVILEEWLLNIEDKVKDIDLIDPDSDAEQFQKAVSVRIENELKTVGSIASSFANAVRNYYKAKQEGDIPLYQAAIGWLKGESIRAEYKKRLGVTGEVKRENAFEFFRALLRMIKATGYEGFVVILDEVETVQKLIRKDLRDAAYENLRLFIDESDRNGFPNCYFLYTGTNELLESEKGFKSLEPFYERVHVENDEKHSNLRQPIIFIKNFDNSKLKQVALKVRDIHGKAYNWEPETKVTNIFIDKLIKDMTMGFGGEIKIKPRGFLRTFVDILDKAQQYEDYIPENEFKFNDEIKRKIEDTESETAHIVNF